MTRLEPRGFMQILDVMTSSGALALFSAVLFGFSINLVRTGLETVDAVTGTLVAIVTSTVAFWLLSPWFIQASFWTSPALLIFGSIGLFRPVITANLSNRGTQRLGPTISQTVASVSPLFGVMGGVILLNERLTVPLMAGTLGIVAGVVVLSWQGRAPREWDKPALLYPIGAAALRALAHVITKAGLNILPSPFIVTLCAFSVSLPLAVGEYAGRGRHRNVNLRAKGIRWFMVVGLVNSVSVLSMNYALESGQVVTVSPIVASSPLFTFLFSKALFRKEVLSMNVVVGMLLIVPSVMLITLFH